MCPTTDDLVELNDKVSDNNSSFYKYLVAGFTLYFGS